MTDRELLAKLDQWHEDNRHKEIIQAIEALPEEEQGEYEMRGRLARALNNTGEFRRAIEVLESVRSEGERDSRWWSRMGYAFYHLDRKEAQECFLTARRLDPENGDARTFLAWLNVGPSGQANAWDGGTARKKGERTGTANGWSEGAGPERTSGGGPKERRAGANGWSEGKGPAGKRPKGDGGTSDWEGRGWEGTARIETLLFGPLHFPVKEGLSRTFPLALGGRSQRVELFIREDLARPERWEAMGRLLDWLPLMYQRARERLEAEYEENQVIRLFIRDQLEEMEEAPLLERLGAKSREEAVPARFAQALELRGVTVAPRPGREEEMDCTLDFCLDPEITDELLVFRFTPEAELYDISHES